MTNLIFNPVSSHCIGRTKNDQKVSLFKKIVFRFTEIIAVFEFPASFFSFGVNRAHTRSLVHARFGECLPNSHQRADIVRAAQPVNVAGDTTIAAA
jgi:hypothetical protein